jgi:Cellulase (glycosyl hydrolase family 5)
MRGPLHTEGARILDARGHTVRFVGINVTGLQAGSGTRASRMPGRPICFGWRPVMPPIPQQIWDWGFNMVRLPIAWADLEPLPPTRQPDGSLLHRYNRQYLAAIDAAVAAFTDRGIGVVIDMHQYRWSPFFVRQGPTNPEHCPGQGMPEWLYRGTGVSSIPDAKIAFFGNQKDVQASFARAWQEVAGRYAHDPGVVGFDLLNEPYASGPTFPPEATDLDSLYQRVGSAIRAVNRTALLVFEDTQDTFTGRFGVTHPPRFRNVVYSFHLYRLNWDPLGLHVTQDYASRATRWDVPLWVGETNLFRGMANDNIPSGWEGSALAMLAYYKAQGFGWAVWAYSGRNSLVAPGTTDPKPQVLTVIQQGL